MGGWRGQGLCTWEGGSAERGGPHRFTLISTHCSHPTQGLEDVYTGGASEERVARWVVEVWMGRVGDGRLRGLFDSVSMKGGWSVEISLQLHLMTF